MSENIQKQSEGAFLSKLKIAKPFFENRKPYTLEVHADNRCPYACTFCIDRILKNVPSINGICTDSNSTSSLTKENMDTIIKGCIDLNIRGIILSGGGEPPMCKNTSYLVEQANLNNIRIGMFTNGYLLNDETIPIYVKNLTFLRFSFDSFTPEIYAKVKGTSEKSYWRVLENIKKCTDTKKQLQSSCLIGMDYIIVPENIDLMLDVYKKANELNVDYIQFCDCVIPSYVYSEKTNQIIAQNLESCLDLKDEFKMQTRIVYEQIQISNQTNCRDCLVKDYIFLARADGGVIPCPHLARHNEMVYGNINEKSLKEIWDNRPPVHDFLYENCRFREQNKILLGLSRIEHGELI